MDSSLPKMGTAEKQVSTNMVKESGGRDHGYLLTPATAVSLLGGLGSGVPANIRSKDNLWVGGETFEKAANNESSEA